jgi:hypothetical protein
MKQQCYQLLWTNFCRIYSKKIRPPAEFNITITHINDFSKIADGKCMGMARFWQIVHKFGPIFFRPLKVRHFLSLRTKFRPLGTILWSKKKATGADLMLCCDKASIVSASVVVHSFPHCGTTWQIQLSHPNLTIVPGSLDKKARE